MTTAQYKTLITKTCIICGEDFGSHTKSRHECCLKCRDKADSAQKAAAREEFMGSLVERWGKVDMGVCAPPKTWTKTAFECFASARNCVNCTVPQAMGVYHGKGCLIPTVVQSLLNRGIPVTFYYLDNEIERLGKETP